MSVDREKEDTTTERGVITLDRDVSRWPYLIFGVPLVAVVDALLTKHASTAEFIEDVGSMIMIMGTILGAILLAGFAAVYVLNRKRKRS